MTLHLSGYVGNHMPAFVPINYIVGRQISYKLCGIIAFSLMARARNSSGKWNYTSKIDIEMAKSEGFIIADASGVPGYVADRSIQRDTIAIPASDKNNIIGESDQ